MYVHICTVCYSCGVTINDDDDDDMEKNYVTVTVCITGSNFTTGVDCNGTQQVKFLVLRWTEKTTPPTLVDRDLK